MSSQNGDPEIYVTDAGGGNLHRITFAAGVNTSPAWNPKTGKQIAFVSDRGGDPVLYLANSDGSGVEKLDLPDMGYSVDRRGHQMDNCWLSAGDAPAAISTSMLWMSSASS